jgi:hypothetical protein
MRVKWECVVAVALAAVLLGCEGGGTTIRPGASQASRTVDMPHYSFTIPAEWTGWTVKKEGGPFEVVALMERASGIPPLLYNVRLTRNTVLDEKVRAMTAKDVAADYSGREEGTMIFEGVMKGQYALYDVARTEETLDGKTAYVMRYRTVSGAICQKASMYLLFPKDSNNDWFIVANYSLSTKGESEMRALDMCKWEKGKDDQVANQFVDMLKGLQVH